MEISLRISGSGNAARVQEIDAALHGAFEKESGRLSASLRLEGSKVAIIDAGAQSRANVRVDYRRRVWVALESAGIAVADGTVAGAPSAGRLLTLRAG